MLGILIGLIKHVNVDCNIITSVHCFIRIFSEHNKFANWYFLTVNFEGMCLWTALCWPNWIFIPYPVHWISSDSYYNHLHSNSHINFELEFLTLCPELWSEPFMGFIQKIGWIYYFFVCLVDHWVLLLVNLVDFGIYTCHTMDSRLLKTFYMYWVCSVLYKVI